ncbi:uncharacterized protein N7473_005824 [Penicillium subrubescens]|uniref:Uncharacterized protein n=1 Tax=Penicillium subrubescens TaxID=1316194 RepID=A0A1Q5UGS1_9EURO|nr:uncharacterized protein N7473_005824 [Penicillium subrubescens]KAJ5896425.1 hypothetical protein N7473_005824 [Penicillium subrubescens]OKP11649.1 hypothetical protein PENSUB_2721 [Penicillium subrubescens]
MKFPAFLSAVALFGHASAFYGQMSASDYFINEGGVYQNVYLKDDKTGSTYSGYLRGGFNGCTSSPCNLQFSETSAGGYAFYASMWRTSDGCHNIDFQGALDSHHGYCCGSLPCDFSA